MIDHELVRRALAFARERHAGQFRDSGEPYIKHPERVADVVSVVFPDPTVVAAALLHDTLEDTKTSFGELVEEFGEEVARLVLEVTREGAPGSNLFPNLRSREAFVLKFADRLDNLADMRGWSGPRVKRYLDKSVFWGGYDD